MEFNNGKNYTWMKMNLRNENDNVWMTFIKWMVKKFTTLKFNNIYEFSHPNVVGNVDENVRNMY
jgi:hypothetical protein